MMTSNCARDPFIKQTCSFVILGAKRFERVNIYCQISENVPRIPPVGPCADALSPLMILQWHFICSSFCMVGLKVGAIIDIIESNNGGRHRSAKTVANPFIDCYTNWRCRTHLRPLFLTRRITWQLSSVILIHSSYCKLQTSCRRATKLVFGCWPTIFHPFQQKIGLSCSLKHRWRRSNGTVSLRNLRQSFIMIRCRPRA